MNMCPVFSQWGGGVRRGGVLISEGVKNVLMLEEGGGGSRAHF
jgi:hypothetical protein